MILKLWISIGSWNIAFQLAVPTQCGEPMRVPLGERQPHDHAQRHDREERKYVIAGSDQRKLGRPTFRPPELLCSWPPTFCA